MLVVGAILMTWTLEPTLADAFAAARTVLVTMYDSRRRPGKTLAGFLKALGRVSDRLLAAWYRRRWGIEVLYRLLKQTMRRRKMLSTRPRHAEMELDWALTGRWLRPLGHDRTFTHAGEPACHPGGWTGRGVVLADRTSPLHPIPCPAARTGVSPLWGDRKGANGHKPFPLEV